MFYSKKVLEHFKNPCNFGKIKDHNAIGKAGNLVCGDLVQIYLKVKKDKKNKDYIEEIKFETFGCASAIATSSVITELAKKKTLKQALKINNRQIIKSLGGLPLIKIHCSLLAVDALSDAIYNYLLKTKQKIPKKLLEIHKRLEKEKKILEKKFGNKNY